jgi:Cofilin/tropomyosin-type actin-binding protein
VKTGDELSKRSKFVFISWIGNDVSAINRAKVSTDKTTVKSVITVRMCSLSDNVGSCGARSRFNLVNSSNKLTT